MKNLIIGLVVAVLGVSLTNAAVFLPSVTISSSSSISFTTAIDKFLDLYVANHTDAQLQTKFSDVEDAITQILDTRALSDRAVFILEYIHFRVKDRLQVNDDDTTNDNDTDTDNGDQARTINVNDYEGGPIMIVAGVESAPVAEFELNASLEKIELEEFTIMATSSSFGDAVKYVRVYDEDGKLVATKNPGEDTATFIGTNLILNKGSNTFYITLEPYAVGESIQAPQTATFTLKWRTDEAVGVTSNNTISVGTVHNTEDIITIAPIGIESIELLDSYEGYHVDEQLFNNVEADLAIVKITFAEGFSFDTSSSEDLEAVLQTLTARLEDGTDGGNIAATLEIQRIDSSSTTIEADINGDLVSFNLTQFENEKNLVEAGEDIVLIIRGTPTLDEGQSESVRLEFDNSTAAVLEYTTTDNDGPDLSSASMEPDFIGSVSIDD